MRAETIAKALGGRKVGGGWMARYRAHEGRNPSLSIHDADEGKVLVRCHAGCDQARVMEVLRTRALWSNQPQVLPPAQLSLFGLVVGADEGTTLTTPCPRCEATVAVIAPGSGPRSAALRCLRSYHRWIPRPAGGA